MPRVGGPKKQNVQDNQLGAGLCVQSESELARIGPSRLAGCNPGCCLHTSPPSVLVAHSHPTDNFLASPVQTDFASWRSQSLAFILALVLVLALSN